MRDSDDDVEVLDPPFASRTHRDVLLRLHPERVPFFVRHEVPSGAFPKGFEAVLLMDRDRYEAARRAGVLLWSAGDLIHVRAVA